MRAIIYPLFLASMITMSVSTVDAFPLPDLPLAAPAAVCGSFEIGTLAHTCCLQFPQDDIARRCCTVGFSPEDPFRFDCCRENAANGIHPGTPEDPTQCESGDPEDPVTDCEIQFPANDIARRCCEVGFEPADEAKFACCQANAANNIHPGTPEDPTACESSKEEVPPDSSEAVPELGEPSVPEDIAPGECLVTALDSEKVNGVLIGMTEDGTGIALKIDYSLPVGLNGAHRVELTQTAGPLVDLKGEAGLTVVDSGTDYRWFVQMGRPEKMIGEFVSEATFKVMVFDLQGRRLHQATCRESAGVQAQGGSSGCSLVR